MKKYVFTFLLIGCIMPLFAQPGANRDSLLNLLGKAKPDTNKVQLLYKLAFYYEMNNLDSCSFYLQKTKALSDSLHYTKGEYLYHERSSVFSYTKGNYTAAMEHANVGLALARQLKDSVLVAIMLNNIAISYSFLEKYHEQLDYTLQVKRVIEALKDSAKLSPLYHNLANCYLNIAQYRKSADCALYSIKLYSVYKKRNDYINRVYGTLAGAYENLAKRDSALYFIERAEAASLKNNDKYALVVLYMQHCNLFANLGQFDKMMVLAQQSAVLAEALQSTQVMASAKYAIAAANFYTGNNAAAGKYIREAIAMAKKDSLTDDLQNSFALLSYIAAREGNFKSLIDARKSWDSIRETALNEQIVKSTAEMESKYEAGKKDNQITLQHAQLEKRQLFIYLLVGSGVLLLTIFLLSYRAYRNKQKLQQQRINELEISQQLTATEAVLKGEEQERTRLAKDLHDSLGGMLSGIKYSMNTMKGNLVMTPENAQAFDRSVDMLDSSIKEMRRVAHNMMPEALIKFGLDTALKDFCNDIYQSGALKVNYLSIGMENTAVDQTTAITIYRIVQELVNNSIKHASAKNAIVQLTKTNGQLAITVEDDGKDFDTGILKNSRGIGWSNIQHRVEFLKGKLDIHSTPDSGTSVLIEINV
ncbi:MAG: sensor histidine kinase [Chitinophagaceae bacterium]